MILPGNDTIRLRAPEISDIDLLYQWENDINLWYLSNTITPFSRHVLEQYILNAHIDIFESKQLRLMIDLQQVPQTTIGAIDLFEFDPLNRRAGIGIIIDSKYRQKGYASNAIDAITDYAFNILHLHQLFCNIDEDNDASLKLFIKCGFNICGTKKQWNLRQTNNWKDEHLLQRIASK